MSKTNDNRNTVPDETTSSAVITPLGTGGWIPVKDRHTACYVFQKDESIVILDFGTGISRLVNEYDYLLNGVDHVIGILSHYHPDHTIGLFYLPAFFGTRHLELYAPGKDIYGSCAKDLLEGIFSVPRTPRSLLDMNPTLEIRDIPLDGMKINDLDFQFRVQRRHVHPSVAVRIGKHLVYCTDTEAEYETIEFAKGARVLLHECWYNQEIPKDPVSTERIKEILESSSRDGHSSNLAVALIAREARIRATHTIHHNPVDSLSRVQKFAQEAACIATYEMVAAEDGKTISC